MDNLFNSGISIEKMSAFLDGNLSASEMQDISSLIDSDASLKQILGASLRIDVMISNYTEADLQMPPEIMGEDFSLPNIENDNFFPFGDDGFLENENLYQHEGLNANEKNFQETEFLNNSETMAKNYCTYSESGENVYDPIFIKQPDDHSCGLRSQQIVLRDFGIDIPFEDLERYALDAGVYSENGSSNLSGAIDNELQSVEDLVEQIRCDKQMGEQQVRERVAKLEQNRTTFQGLLTNIKAFIKNMEEKDIDL